MRYNLALSIIKSTFFAGLKQHKYLGMSNIYHDCPKWSNLCK